MTTETTDQTTYLSKTRLAYDIAAASYAEIVPPLFGRDPYGHAMLNAFAELVRDSKTAGPVADLGCGPGHVTAHLRGLGLDAFGVDLSPQMIAQARAAHPDLRFEEGSMTALDLADGSLAGAVAWYSTVHTPPEVLPVLFAEIHRVLAPGGRALIAFKVGDRIRHLDHGYGHDLDLDVYWRSADEVAQKLAAAGLPVEGRLVHEPDDFWRANGQGQQGFLIAQKPNARTEQRS
ncbi:class I SAM-dependent methyltransferase [Streptomyces sp. VRA16 Mangrove soil]|uniref:class I SAM-dependent DNA methyltransferase n=1 Tax=Streptomyces sp. VRA16 Mangrove soil TaxID=2817434 RepID=UPI001A9FB163|nr:class I SAM-dependent methyltransferase [Streptomyces sp. VRA16 Mangrove soil]MBO1331211.1 class I SAM-dependent methyltransferase [Streptomyces sp. VRA16 Mangrove soil]